jgi:SAM-dependent methyltransferase
LKDGANADLELVCTEVYDIPDSYNNCFDVLVITVGVLVWLPDISKVFAILNRLLRRGGHLFIHEQHPILEMISLTESEDGPIVWEISYFHKGPFVESKGLDYYRNVAYDTKPTLSFSHTLADIIMSGINNGLVLKAFKEYPDNISLAWPNVEKSNIGLPMSYSMVFQKSGKGDQ